MIYIFAATAFAVGAFQVSAPWAMLVLLLGTGFFGVGIAPVLSAFAAELFPTEIRAQASAWIRNGAGNVGSVLGPALVGVLGAAGGLVGNVGDTVSILSLVALPIIVIVWRILPETRGIGLIDSGPS
jgi:putative MFS transporter